ncbi:MAG: hypothetical protein OXH19_09675 [Chloroflexi bacterium]|nr:hypothetical protein [Chloroflexota bacterium]MCY3588893.1 hypothetical protein [Chloroflexota bacterium]MCY3686203.1 hypothetical protein [Chloroflexota bacterium]MDE2708824.1 hypothetical protein [Chloroflexota bacterium]
MPNPFHFRASIDRLWRQANSDAPAYRRLNALDKVVRELFAPNERARLNHQLYLATDPYDVARHLLRDLYDRPDIGTSLGSLRLPLPLGEACPALDAGGWGEGPPALPKEETPDEDDDPL